MTEEIMEESIREIIRSIIKSPVLKPLIEEELHKYYFSDKYLDEESEETNNNSVRLSRLTIDEGFRIYLNDFDNKEVLIDGFQAKTLFLFYLLIPFRISNVELQNYKKFITSLYEKIRGCDYDIASQSIIGLFGRDDGINDANSKIRRAFKTVIGDEEILRYYIINGPKGKKRCIMLPKQYIKIKNNVLRKIILSFRKIEQY